MKRTHSQDAISSEPDAKVARIDVDAAEEGTTVTTPATDPVLPPAEEGNGEPVELPSLDWPWRFISPHQEGGLHIHEWHPRSSPKAEEVARAFIKAHEKSRPQQDEKGYPLLYFWRVLTWCRDLSEEYDHPTETPVEFEAIKREDLGEIKSILDADSEHSFTGTYLRYHSWC